MADLPGIDALLKNGTLKLGNSPDLEIRRISTGIPSLDTLLGGGIPLGHCCQLYGPESTGKTLIAQIIVAAVQKSQHPLAMFMDMEGSYDKVWWDQSGVDTEALLVSHPVTAEAAINVMRGVINSTKELGIIVVDSIAAMIPQPLMDPEKSSEDSRQPGQQAKVLTQMYQQIMPLLDNRIIFLTTNQMRDNIGGHDELAPLPGGRANRHYNHIILRTRRENWITQGDDRIGFYMEIVSRKNKMATVADGDNIKLPFMFTSQIDWTTSYLEDAISQKIITRKGPYYYWGDKNFMGMANLRNFFLENPNENEELKRVLGITTA